MAASDEVTMICQETIHARRVLFAIALLPPVLFAQGKFLRVTSAAGVPIPLASVWLDGAQPRMTDSTGTIPLSSMGAKPVQVEVRRVGFAPWRGPVTLTDSGATIQLAALAQPLGAVTVTEHHAPMTLALQGFYRRAIDRQKGLGSGTFISPEQVERRNPQMVADVLREVNGVSLERAKYGGFVAMGKSGICQMAIVVDGVRVRSPGESIKGTNPGMSLQGGGRGAGASYASKHDTTGGWTDANAVILDQIVSVSALAAVEIYPRSSFLPPELEQPSDAGCGLIAIWTGARR